MTAAVVTTEGLSHNYGEVRALDRVTLEIPPGITGLVGANGAGKTTLLRILLGLIHPTAGRAVVMGHDAITDPLSVRSRSGYMPENNCLPKDQTAADFVAFAAELAGLPALGTVTPSVTVGVVKLAVTILLGTAVLTWALKRRDAL